MILECYNARKDGEPKMDIQISKGKGFDRIRIEEGIYEATVAEVKDLGIKVFKARKPSEKDKEAQALVIEFDVEVRKGQNTKRLGFVGYTPATPNNKLGLALLALGINLDKLDVIKTDSLIGLKARVMVEDYEKEINGEKVVLSGIAKVKPLTRQSAADEPEMMFI